MRRWDQRGEFGRRSSFDVVPAIVDLLGEVLPGGLSGRSLLNPIV